MRRLSPFLAILALIVSTNAPAAVVERLSPMLDVSGAPVPALSMSGAVSASFTPALTPTLTSLSFAPSPALLPALPAAAAPLHPVAAPVAAIAAQPLSAPASQPRERGPPTAQDAGFSAHVARTIETGVRSWSVPVERIFAAHDALLVGENHGSLSSVDAVAREMPRLVAAGVTSVGIEGLKAPNQQAVDDYVFRRTDVLPEAALSFSPKRAASFKALLEAAREHGVRVVALGLPLDGWAKQAAELAAANTGRPVNSFPNTVDGLFTRAGDGYERGFNEAVAEVFLTRRNKAMANFLKDALRVGGKAVVLVGQAHVDGLDMVPGRLMNAPGDWGTLTRELGALALDAYSLTMTGGLFTSYHDARNDREARPESYREAAAASPKGGSAFVELGPSRALWHAGGTVAEPEYAH